MFDRYDRTAVTAALKSGAFIKRSVGKIRDIRYKGRINLVTDIDRKAEELIITEILKAFPGHSILSEESRPVEGGTSFKWIIDPLDGTTNFVHSFPFFCVSIALERDGGIVLGVVYDPSRNELFLAKKGRGAFLNNKKIRVSGKADLGKGFLATGFAYGLKEARDNNIRNFERFLMNSLAVRRAGSAALDLSYVACGRFDGFWERDLHPWDSAAGVLLIKEAGGVVTRFDGTPFSHYDKELLASNGLIHSKMVKILSTKY